MKTLKYKIRIVFLSILIYGTAVGQETFNLEKLPVSSADQFTLKKFASAFDLISIDAPSLSQYLQSRSGWSTIQLHVENGPQWTISLTKNDMRSPGYKSVFTTENGEVAQPLENCNTYKGVLHGSDRSEFGVRLTIEDNQIQGYIATKNEFYYIEPAIGLLSGVSETKHLLYKGSNVIVGDEFRCGAEEVLDFKDDIDRQSAGSNTSGSRAVSCVLLEIATDADHEFWQDHGSSSNADILGILNQVEGLYESTFGISFFVTFQNVFTTSSDPYTASGSPSSSILAEIRDEWSTNRFDVPRDLVHLFSGKNHGTLLGSVSGGLPSICSAPQVSHGFTADRTNAFLTTAHEIGHNFNGRHSDGEDCGTSSASIMCQGIKANPPHFSSDAINRINNHINSYPYCIEIDQFATHNSLLPIWNGENFFGDLDLLSTQFTVGDGGKVNFISGFLITIDPGAGFSNSYFEVELGGEFYAGIHNPCAIDVNNSPSLKMSEENSGEETLDQGEMVVSAFPNPFQDHINLEIKLNKATQVAMNVTDFYGSQVRQFLKDEELQEGTHTFSLSSDGLRSGIYFCTVIFDGKRKMYKLMLIN